MGDDEAADGPDWGLLPDDPAAFFGLGPGFERADLKRAYARLLRRFKPERSPAEFMRLRAAYERLDARLCYGAEEAVPALDPAPIAGVAPLAGFAQGPEAAPLEGASRVVDVPPRLDVAALVRELGPAAARGRVASVVGDDARLWCALALLDDALEARPAAFARTLMDGLRAAADTPALVVLLHGALREQVADDVAAALLRESAALTHALWHGAGAAPRRRGPSPRDYWFLTDHLWLKLAERAPFERFAALLEACRATVGEGGRTGELVLLVRLRRRVALRADDAWLHAVDRDLDEGVRDLPSWAEVEFDLARWLGRYRAVRADVLALHPFCEVLDGALEAIVTGDEAEAERSFLDAMIACVERRDELFAACARWTPALHLALGLLSWYGDDYLVRRGAYATASAEERAHALEFTRRLERRSERSLVGRLFSVAALALFLVCLVLAVTLGALSTVVLHEWGLVTLVLAAAVVIGAHRGWLAPLVVRIAPPFTRRLHARVWRPMTADYLRASRLSFGALIEVMGLDEAATGGFEYNALSRDRGLELYALAVRSLD
ncbi:MAG: hypothetical protein R3F49_01400 [Planctomycetota bacterium]